MSKHSGLIPDTGVYLTGVWISALVSCGVVALLANSAFTNFHTPRLVIVIVGTCLILLFEAIRAWAGLPMSTGLRRQTPYRWRMAGPVGVFGWGLDTGIPVTTVRATPMPLVATMCVVAGLSHWWVGVAYAAGITAGLHFSLAHSRKSERSLSPLGHLQPAIDRLGQLSTVRARGCLVCALVPFAASLELARS